MAFLLRYGVLIGLIVAWIWCVLDVIRTDAGDIKYLHKLVWLALVVLVPTVGSIAWLVVGRPTRLGARLIAPPPAQRPPPDDSPEFLRSVGEEIRKRRRTERRNAPPRVDPEDQARIDEELRRLEEQFRSDAPPSEDDSDPKA